MKHLFNYKIWVILFIGLMASPNNYGQHQIISSAGNLQNNASLSSAIVFKSNAACIDVQSGIAVFNSFKGFGEFVVNCEVKVYFNTLGIKIYPNPVKTISKVKFIKTPPLKDFFNITICNTDGTFIKSIKETGYNIFQGIDFDLANLTPGGYILKIESSKYLEAIKFIKAN